MAMRPSRRQQLTKRRGRSRPGAPRPAAPSAQGSGAGLKRSWCGRWRTTARSAGACCSGCSLAARPSRRPRTRPLATCARGSARRARRSEPLAPRCASAPTAPTRCGARRPRLRALQPMCRTRRRGWRKRTPRCAGTCFGLRRHLNRSAVAAETELGSGARLPHACLCRMPRRAEATCTPQRRRLHDACRGCWQEMEARIEEYKADAERRMGAWMEATREELRAQYAAARIQDGVDDTAHAAGAPSEGLQPALA